MSVDSRGPMAEPAFVTGALLGVLAIALGLAMLVLGLSVGMREGTYLTETQDLAIGVIGVLGIGTAIAVRAMSSRFNERKRPRVKLIGTLIGLTGSMFVLFAMSAETTVSAPFLINPSDKVVLFVVSYVLFVGGWLVLKAAARMVGWQ